MRCFIDCNHTIIESYSQFLRCLLGLTEDKTENKNNNGESVCDDDFHTIIDSCNNLLR